MIRQKYLCLFLCEKVHFFPLGSFQIFTEISENPFDSIHRPSFSKEQGKSQNQKKYSPASCCVRRLIFGFFFFVLFLSNEAPPEMPIFKQEVKTTMDDEKKAKFHTFESGKKSEIDSPDPRPLYFFFFFFFFFFFCFYHRYSCLLVVVMRVVPRDDDDDDDDDDVVLLLSPPLSSPQSKRKRFC